MMLTIGFYDRHYFVYKVQMDPDGQRADKVIFNAFIPRWINKWMHSCEWTDDGQMNKVVSGSHQQVG